MARSTLAHEDLAAKLAEKEAVIARVKAYLEVGLQDKRMRIWTKILLDEVARIEREEREKTQSGGRSVK